jgi:integrase
MAKRPMSGSAKPRTKLMRVDERRSMALPEFEKLKVWAAATLAHVDGIGHIPPDARELLDSTTARAVRNAVVVLVLLGTAARRFELCSFRCGDFRESFGKHRCYFEGGKGNVEAEIPVSEETWNIVQRWLVFKRDMLGESIAADAPLFCGQAGSHLGVAQLHNIWVAVRKEVGIAPRDLYVSVHMTRHTAGFLYLRATNSLSATAEFMRHKSQAITERFYKHVLDEDVTAGLKKARL